jgi:amidophosphoribosyltransferase
MESLECPPSAKYLDPNSDNYLDMVERIRYRLGLATLQYQQLDDLVKAIGLPKEGLCTCCWDGKEKCCERI